jgi:galactonate dehydratase
MVMKLCIVSLDHKFVIVSPKTTWTLMTLTLSNGVSGYAEATKFGFEPELESELSDVARHIAQERPALDLGVLAYLGSRPSSLARDIVCNGVEFALADALARSNDLTLAAQFGGAWRHSVPCYANINRGSSDRTPAGFAAQARAILAIGGYDAIKIAPFDGYHWDTSSDPLLIEAGLARAAAIRDAIGSDVRLMIDCHSRFDVAGARRVIESLAPIAPFWIEDPVDSEKADGADQSGLRRLAHRHGIRIAGGERLMRLDRAQRLFGLDALDVVLPDLRLTGLRNGLSMLDLAIANGIEVSLHNPVSPVLDGLSRHLAATLPHFLILERQVGETPLYDEIAGELLMVALGCIGLGEGAGFGFTPRLTGHRQRGLG